MNRLRSYWPWCGKPQRHASNPPVLLAGLVGVACRSACWALLVLLVVAGCRQADFVSGLGGQLDFSVDTLRFDTVFSPLGSITRVLVVRNRSNSNIEIEQVRLERGTLAYAVNVDGNHRLPVQGVRIAKHDSIFVFVELQSHQADFEGALLQEDRLLFESGGESQALVLEAYSRHAEVVPYDTLPPNYVFTRHRPYIVKRRVVVAAGQQAQIQAGAQLYFDHKGAVVVHGGLQVGDSTQCTLLSLVRYNDPWYSTHTAQWQGVIIEPGATQIDVVNTYIKCPDKAFDIKYSGSNQAPHLVLRNVIVENASIAIQATNADIDANNCLFFKSDVHPLMYDAPAGTVFDPSVALDIEGGVCRITNSTFYSRHRRSVTQPLVSLRNSDTAALVQAVLANTIVWGGNLTEVRLQHVAQDKDFNFRFDACLLLLDNSFDHSNTAHFMGIITDNPLWIDADKKNLRLQSGSPAIRAGNPTYTTTYDIEYTPRAEADMGAYAGGHTP